MGKYAAWGKLKPPTTINSHGYENILNLCHRTLDEHLEAGLPALEPYACLFDCKQHAGPSSYSWWDNDCRWSGATNLKNALDWLRGKELSIVVLRLSSFRRRRLNMHHLFSMFMCQNLFMPYGLRWKTPRCLSENMQGMLRNLALVSSRNMRHIGACNGISNVWSCTSWIREKCFRS